MKIDRDKEILKVAQTPEIVHKSNRRDTIKIIVFNIINILLIIIVIFIIRRIPKEAEKVKNLRSEEVAAQESQSVGVLLAELEKNQSQIDKINGVFVNESKFVNFVTSIEAIRSEGIITEVSFPLVNPVKDADGNFGLPVSVVARGNIDQINSTVTSIVNLPFLIRTVNANLEVVNQTDQVYILRLGLFLYVDEEFSKN